MPEITQKLGFDTGGAVSSILNMDNALRGLNTRLRAFNEVTSSSNQSKIVEGFGAVKKKAEAARSSVNRLGDSLQETGTRGRQSVQTITASFGGLAKALVAREAVQALNRLKTELLESAEAAAKFEEEVARISNIAQGPGSSIASLTETLAKMAVELGRPQTEVLSAAFEALQNDLGTTEETMRLLTGAANDLALVTGGTLTQSVNSITSVLKAYDIDISQASDVTDIFFAAIDKGRITLAELENSLGKITPLAAKLEIPFEEVAAAMASITQSGTSASVANTQLRSIFQKLIRPTEKLKEAFSTLGVETFQELITQSGGLQQALTAIAEALGNDDRAIAEAFGRLRGQLGVFNLLANEGQIFTETLEAIADRAGKAAEGADKIDATNARKSQKAWARFDETMRQVGDTVLEVQTIFIKTFNTVVVSGEAAIKVILGLGAAAGTAAIGVYALGASFAVVAPWAALIGLIGVAVYDLTVIIDRAAQSWHDAADEARKFVDETTKIDVNQIGIQFRKQTEEIRQATQDSIKSVQSLVEGIDTEYGKLVKRTEARQTQIREIAKSSVEAFVNGTSGIMKEINDMISDITDRVKSIEDAAKETGKKIEELEFEKSVEGLTATQRAMEYLNNATKDLIDLREKAGSISLDPQTSKDFARQQAEVEKKFDQAVQEAERTGNAYTIRKAKEARLSALKAIEKEQLAAAERVGKFEASIDQENKEKNFAALRELQRIASEAVKLDVDSKKFDEASIDWQTALDDIDPTFFEKFGKSQELQDMVKKVEFAMRDLKVRFPTARNELQAALDSAPFNAVAKFSISGGTGDLALDTKLGEISKLENPAARVEEMIKALGDFEVAQAAAANKAEQFERRALGSYKKVAIGLKELEIVNKKAARAGPTDISESGRAVFESLKTEAERAKSVTAETAGAQEARLKTIEEVSARLEKEGMLYDEQGKAIRSTLESIREGIKNELAKKAQQDLINPEAAAKAQAQLEAVQDAAAMIDLGLSPKPLEDTAKAAGETAIKLHDTATSAQLSSTNMQGMSISTESTNTSAGNLAISMGNVATQTQSSVAAMQQLAIAASAALAKAKAANAAASGQAFAYYGGKINYRAVGGPITRGQDKYLTALSAGESVINARSTRKFFSQIQAMNAGQTPQYRDKGGPVTNIGDINVNVTTNSDSPEQFARVFASDLRRELRRKTSKPF